VAWWLDTNISKDHAAAFAINIEKAWSSETVIFNHHTAWYNNPENKEFYLTFLLHFFINILQFLAKVIRMTV
jgi:hypothetical protein